MPIPNSIPPDVATTATSLESGMNPWAPNGPQNATEWGLCAAAWQEVARRRSEPTEEMVEFAAALRPVVEEARQIAVTGAMDIPDWKRLVAALDAFDTSGLKPEGWS